MEISNSDLNGIQKVPEYLMFVDFVALPLFLRKEVFGFELEKEFAQRNNCDKNTLGKWKKRDGFWERVSLERKKWAKEKVTEVLAGLYRTAIRDGKAQEVKLFLQYADEFVDEIKIKTEENYSPELVEKVKKTLENEGFTITPTDTGKQGDEKDSGKE